MSLIHYNWRENPGMFYLLTFFQIKWSSFFIKTLTKNLLSLILPGKLTAKITTVYWGPPKCQTSC
jgi:hypothetical protein